ncbi:hypothetical protein [Oricola thermophila]|uniref:Lipoprotein n=1 Tax=Oricola thermophila TaxID=2742145 RepID=A0A6N1VEA4_9HYPH|nr:hypothetical protein [Oricola thermophila]QKV18863.1 hypothetical protein HTY61_10580 [Oricola thermophila]
MDGAARRRIVANLVFEDVPAGNGFIDHGLAMSFAMTVRAARFGALLGFVALASCQSMKVGDTLSTSKAGDEELSAADLRAYCPRVTLLEGTAILKTYAKGHKDDPDHIIYQATITDVTRSCKYEGGNLYMQVAAAGRVVWGPKGAGGSGSLELPVRVAVKQGENLPYSRLGKITVSVPPTGDAVQFIYKDDQVVVPAPTSPNLQVIAGFDEGPYDTP